MKQSLILFIAFILFSCADSRKISSNSNGYITTKSGLQYKILKRGKGEPAKEKHEVLIFETTTYLSGTVLYSNENTERPVKVLIGGNQATSAVDEGLRGMQVGEGLLSLSGSQQGNGATPFYLPLKKQLIRMLRSRYKEKDPSKVFRIAGADLRRLSFALMLARGCRSCGKND